MRDIYTVEKVLNNGWGLARSGEGEAVFIAGGLPGEKVRVTGIVKRKGAKWAETHQRLDESPLRAAPSCPHFEGCGGCQLLHVKRSEELGIKLDFLKDCLRRIGRIDQAAIEAYDFPMEGSRIRGKLHIDRGSVGFKTAGSHRVSAVDRCQVLPGGIRGLLPDLERMAKADLFRGEICFATDIRGLNPVLAYRGRTAARFDSKTFLPHGAKGAVFRDGPKLRRLGDPFVEFQWRRLNVRLMPFQFFQSNPLSWPLFFELVDRYLASYQPRRVWDAHAGSGFLTSCLEGLEAVCSEPDHQSWLVLKRALDRGGFRYRGYHGKAEQALDCKDLGLDGIDGLILDPPRPGLSPRLRDWLLRQGPSSLLYFSCDMASFSRDLAVLNAAYRLCPPISAMNVNPGTLRLELSATLSRRGETA